MLFVTKFIRVHSESEEIWLEIPLGHEAVFLVKISKHEENHLAQIQTPFSAKSVVSAAKVLNV